MKVEYIRSDRRTMALEVTKDLRVLVRLPRRYPQERAERFVREHRDWILAHLQQQAARAEKYEKSTAQIEALRLRAKAHIPERVAYFSRLTGLTPTGVRITSARTRFGSCTAKNSLNFSLFLMEYSEGAVDYVVLHELCHIKHKNHGKEFYALVAQYMPDYKKYVKELRK